MAVIQFIPGVNETVIPDVRLTRSRDGVWFVRILDNIL